MIYEEGDPVRHVRVRRRIVLEVVEQGEATGFVIPRHASDQVMYRGEGEADYTCGCCGHMLAIGVREGLFPTLVFACGCGALNKVPHPKSRASTA